MTTATSEQAPPQPASHDPACTGPPDSNETLSP